MTVQNTFAESRRFTFIFVLFLLISSAFTPASTMKAPLYAAPTIDGAFVCTTAGFSPWCKVGYVTSIGGDPLGSYTVVISGDVNGVPFTCPTGNVCDIPVTDSASGVVNIRSFGGGLWSPVKTVTYKLDSTPPVTSVNVTGTSMLDGWMSAATVTAVASDSISGLSSAPSPYLFVDNVAVASPVVLTNGTHTVETYAVNNTGASSRSAITTVKVDNVPPTITITPSSLPNAGGWYKVAPLLTASGTDASSGIKSVLFSNGLPTMTPASIDGIQTLTVTAIDNAGNSYTSHPNISLDVTPPTASVNTSSLLPGTNGWYVGLTNVVSADGTDPIGGSGIASKMVSVDGGAWQTSVDLTDGTHSVVARVIDLADNVTTSAPLTIKVDKTTPTATWTFNGSSVLRTWYNADVLVSFISSDATSGIYSDQYTIGAGMINGNSATLTADTNIFTTKVLDNAGNILSASKTFSIDRVKPTVSIIPQGTPGSNGWRTAPISLSLTAYDALSGIDLIEYRINGGSWTTYLLASLIPIDGSTLTFEARSRDTAGNYSDIGLADFAGMKIDNTPPLLTATFSGTVGTDPSWYKSNVTITASASDPESDVSLVEYRVDGGSWQNGNETTISTSGSHSIDFRATNGSGFVTTNSYTAGIDVDFPSVSVLPSTGTGWITGNTVNMHITASDLTSGIYKVYSQINSGAFVEGADFTISDISGLTTLVIKAVDLAGNETIISKARSDFNIDSSVPLISVAVNGTLGTNSWYTSSVVLTATSSDLESGIQSTEYRVDSGTWTASDTVTVSTNGSHVVDFRTTNNAGMITSTSNSFKIDSTLPTSVFLAPTGTLGATGWYNGAVNIGINSADALSGILRTEYRIDGGAWITGTAISISAATGDISSIETRAIDNAGNISVIASKTMTDIKRDTTAPQIIITSTPIDGSNGWYKTTPTVTAGSSDTISGLFKVEHKVNSGPWLSGSIGNFSGVTGCNSYSETQSIDLLTTNVVLPCNGTQTVSFRATNNAGLVSDIQTINVKIDNVQPNLFTDMQSSLPKVGYYWKAPLTITLTGSDLTSGVDYFEYAEYNGHLLSEATWVRGDTISSLPEGVYLYAFRVVDKAGNKIGVVDMSIQIDTSLPIITSKDLVGTLGTNGEYKSNVFARFYATANISTVKTYECRLDGGAWVACAAGYTLGYSGGGYGLLVTTNGTHTIDFRATDYANDVSDVSSLTFFIDKTIPVVTNTLTGTLASNGSGWYVSPVTVNINAVDAVTSNLTVQYRLTSNPLWTTGNSFTINSGATNSYYMQAIDNAGNVGTTSAVINIDVTPPTLSATLSGTLGTGGIYTSNVLSTASPSDTESYIDTTEYKLDGGAWQTYTTSFKTTISTDGNHTMDYRTTNKAGIVSTLSKTFTIDRVAPTTTISPSGTLVNGWYSGDVTLNFISTDATSGIKTTQYRVNGGGWLDGNSLLITPSDIGKIIDSRSIDNAGLISTTATLDTSTLSMDSTIPSITVTLPSPDGLNGWYVNPVNVVAVASDADSGISLVEYRINNGTWKSGDSSATWVYNAVQTPDFITTTITLVANDTQTVDFRAKNNAGLFSNIESVSIKLDQTHPDFNLGPQLGGIQQVGGYWTSPVTFNMSATDTYSGVDYLRYNLYQVCCYSEADWIKTDTFTLNEGIHFFLAQAVDKAGNQGGVSYTLFSIDTSSPTITEPWLQGTLGLNGKYTSPVSTLFRSGDSVSGVKTNECRADGGAWGACTSGYAPGFGSGLGLSIATDGTHTVDFRATDNAGHSTTKSVTFFIDQTVPTITTVIDGTLGLNGWYTTPVTLSITANDPNGGPVLVEYRLLAYDPWTTGNTIVINNGSNTVHIQATDDAGNVYEEAQTVKIDATPPLLSVNLGGTLGTGGIYTGTVTATAVVSDYESSILSTEYRLDGGTWSTGTSKTINTDGTHTIDFRTTNKAGIITSNSKSFIIDSVPPTTSIIPSGTLVNGWYSGNVTLNFNSTDATSGIKTTQYRIDGGSWIDGTSLIITPSDIGKIIDSRSIDNGGLTSTTANLDTSTLNMDSTVPDLTVTVAPPDGLNGWYVNHVPVVAVASDANSGLSKVEYRVNNGIWRTGNFSPSAYYVVQTPDFATTTVTFTENDVQTVDFRATNKAGLVSDIKTVSVKIDLTHPLVTLTPQTDGISAIGPFWLAPVTFNITATDTYSGVASYSYKNDYYNSSGLLVAGTETPGDTYTLGNGSYYLYAYATDQAGNVGSTIISSFAVDTEGLRYDKAVEGTLGLNGRYTSDVTTRITAYYHVPSGIGPVMCRLDGGTWYACDLWYGFFVKVTTEGPHTVEYTISDNAGHTDNESFYFIIDKYAPQITLTPSGTMVNGWYTGPVSVSITTTDTISSIIKTEYKVCSDSSWTTGTDFVINSGVNTNLCIRATDEAGNVNTLSQMIYIDSSSPTMAVTLTGTKFSEGVYTSDVTVQAIASDPGSGVFNTLYRVNGGAWQNGETTGQATVIASNTGSYTVDFRSTNYAGMVTDETRTFVIDKTAPSASFTKVGTLGTNGWYTSNVDVTINSSDTGGGVATVEYRINNGSWLTGTIPTFTNGTYTLDARVTDTVGNATTVSTTVKVSTSVPSINISLSGTNGLSGWYTSSVDVTINASDANSGISLTEYRLDSGVWKTGTTFTISTDGTHTVDARTKNNAGLTSTTSATVKIDATAPSASLPNVPLVDTGLNGWWIKSPSTVVLTSSDTTSGILSSVVSIDGGSWVNTSDLSNGTHVVSGRAMDVAGNTTLTADKTYKVDTVIPSVSLTLDGTIGSNGWYVSDVTFTSSAADITSGLASTTSSVNGVWSSVNTQTISVDGVYTIIAKGEDNAGLLNTITKTAKIDQTAPMIDLVPSGTLGSNGWYTSDVSANISVTEVTSGILSTEYRINNGTWITGTTISPLTDGNSVIDSRSTDKAGNVSDIVSKNINIDTTVPLLNSTLSGVQGLDNWYLTPVDAAATASDDGSGIDSIYYNKDGEGWVIGDHVIVNDDGTHTVQFRAVNKAGLITEETLSFKLDVTPPVVAFTSSTGTLGTNGWYISPITVLMTATDPNGSNQSGPGLVEYSVDSVNWIQGTTATINEGNTTVNARSYDKAGNVSSVESANYSVDLTSPSLSLSVDGISGSGSWYMSDVTVSATVDDLLSGISLTEYRLNGGAWIAGTTVLLSDGVYTVDFRTTDKAGLVTSDSVDVSIDKNPPSTSFSLSGTVGDNEWYTSPLVVTLTAIDTQSGVDVLEYRLNSGTWVSGDTITLNDGTTMIDVRATDFAGNVSPISNLDANGFKVDTTAPSLVLDTTGTKGSSDWYITDVVVNATASDTTSGIALTEYRINNGTWNTGDSVTIKTDGTYIIDFRTKNNAGLVSNSSTSFKRDATVPSVIINPTGTAGTNGWYISDVTLNFVSDDVQSGVFYTEYRLNSGTWTKGTTLVLSEGKQMVETRVVDNAGNVTSIKSNTYNIDKTAPSLNPSLDGTKGLMGWYISSTNAHSNPLDSLSNIALAEYRLDGGTWTVGKDVEILTDGTHTIDFRVTDTAGWTKSDTISFKQDRTVPISQFINPPEGQRVQGSGVISFSGKSADITSGVSSAQISTDNGLTWLPLSLSSGQWAYSWNTANMPDGVYTILVKANDNAGNLEHTAQVQIVLGNLPPTVDVQNEWWVSETGYVKITKQGTDLKNTSVRISCYPSHSDLVINYPGNSYPSGIKWDGKCGDGVLAASGSYFVTVQVCDVLNHCDSDKGMVKVPYIYTPVPTSTSTSIPKATRTPTATPGVYVTWPSATPTKIVVTKTSIPSATPTATITETAQPTETFVPTATRVTMSPTPFITPVPTTTTILQNIWLQGCCCLLMLLLLLLLAFLLYRRKKKNNTEEIEPM